MLQDAVAGFEITLGKEHPSTLISKRYLTLVRFELRETHLTQAMSELKEVLVGLAASMGANHPITLDTQRDFENLSRER